MLYTSGLGVGLSAGCVTLDEVREDFQIGGHQSSGDFEIQGAASLRSLQGCGFFDQ